MTVSLATDTLSTRDWLDAAREIMLREGIDAVKVGRIAKQCGVTRGGFYWRFKDRAELLDALLNEWRETNTKPLVAALTGDGTPAERFLKAALLWVEEADFDPRFDAAVRNWALKSTAVAAVVREVDHQRIDAFAQLFSEAGCDADEAAVRARVLYFHQVGYYALRLEESSSVRRRLLPMYNYVLTGLFPKPQPA